MGQQSSDILEIARGCLSQDDLVEVIDTLTAMLGPARWGELDAYMAGEEAVWETCMPESVARALWAAAHGR